MKDVRGKGLFLSLELQDDVSGDALTAECMKRRLLVKATHKTVIRMAPALVIEEDELLAAAESLHEAVLAVEKNIAGGRMGVSFA